MNTEKFTQKTAEAVRAAQSVSVEHGNAEIAPEHLCYALIAQEDGLIGSILKKKGVLFCERKECFYFCYI